jgi:hypothetical protein
MPHLVLIMILLKYRVQLHQLTLNAIAQLSKYFWAVLSLSGEPSSDGFAKHYELHYQPKKVVVDGFEKFQQFGVNNFLAKRGLLQLLRTSGRLDGRGPSFTARYPCMFGNREGNPSMLFIHT